MSGSSDQIYRPKVPALDNEISSDHTVARISISPSQGGNCTKDTPPSVPVPGEEISPDQAAPFGLDTPVSDIPEQSSRRYLERRDFNAGYYDSLGREDRLDAIESLAAVGNDLALIKEVLHKEDDSALRVATVTRLSHEHSYAVSNILLDALDDPADEVRIAALNAIAQNGDRTLIPVLEERMQELPDGAVREEVIKSIHKLKYSVTMAMDGLPAE